ncbi:Omp28-related outer membrane protein [bacterium]|nr:Omp28-related outer membrane protein [bacterium]
MGRQRVLAILLVFALTAISAISATRVPFLERFTNISCGYCPPCGAMCDSLSDYYGDQLAVVEVHCNWPSSGDPFYVAAPTDNQSRWTHYAVSGVPAVAVDGNKIGSWSSASSLISSLLYDIAALDITIIPGDIIHVQVNVETPITGTNNRLFVAVVEDSNYNPTSPNGEVWANNVLRKLLPSASGQLIDLNTIGSQNFSFPLTLDPSWNTDNLMIVAWVQDWSAPTTAYNVHNAQITDWRLMGYFHSFAAEHNRNISEPGDTASFTASIENIGSYDDTYAVWIETDLPTGWTSWAKQGSTTFDSTGITLSSLTSSEIDVFITPGVSSGGQGKVNVLLKSEGDTTASIDTLSFTVLAGGDLLYVATQGAVTATGYFHDLFADNGVNYQEWSITRDGSLPDLSNAPYDAIVWHDALNLEASMSIQDRNSVKNYLDNGGKMLVTSASWARTVGSIFDFYYLAIGAVSDGIDSSPSSITGTYGGTEFTGYTASLGGAIAEGFTPQSPSRGILRLGSGKTCGLIRETDGGGRLVYISFMLEDISNSTQRDDFWGRVLEFWGGLDVEDVELPENKALLCASPNPFNSSVRFDYSINERADLEIFDISGRLVFSIDYLEAGTAAFMWEGYNNAGIELPTGVYLVKLTTNSGSTSIRKVLLAK